RLTEWLQQKIGPADFFTVEGEDRVTLQANWLPTLKTAQAVVTQACFSMRLVTDGEMLTEATYEIRHDTPQNWQVSLPAGSEILTCPVNGAPARPSKSREDLLDSPLTTSPNNRSQVAFTYA